MRSVCRCSLPVWRRSFLKKGTPLDLFLPCPGSAPEQIWPKNNNTCKGPWVLHPYQVSSKSIKRFWRRSRKCEKFTDAGRTTTTTTDGRTDDALWQKLTWAFGSGELKKTNTSSQMLLDHCYTFGLLLWPSNSEEVVLWRRALIDLLWPCPRSTTVWIWPKSQYKCAGVMSTPKRL